MKTRHYSGSDTYRPGNAWFICDRCGQRHRRSAMLTEWDNLKVDIACLDPRPPQMDPPDVYPEGMPFMDARPPQDNSDRLMDDTELRSTVGGIRIALGGSDANPGTPGLLLDSSAQDIDDSNDLPIETDGFPGTAPVAHTTVPGALSPLMFEQSPFTQGPTVLADDVTFITGPVPAPTVSD